METVWGWEAHARKWIYLTISRHSENRPVHDTCNSRFFKISFSEMFWTILAAQSEMAECDENWEGRGICLAYLPENS